MRDAVISFGEVSVPGLMAALTDTAETQRIAAASDLGRIASDSTRSISASARAAIRTALLHVLNGDERVIEVRLNAIYALLTFTEGDVRSTMVRLAVSDTLSASSAAYRVRYPVREAAKAWLAKHPR